MLGGLNIGGKGIWFSKVFYLKKHSRVTVSLHAYGLDSWDNEYFKVDADGKNIIN